jgi:cathepsin L
VGKYANSETILSFSKSSTSSLCSEEDYPYKAEQGDVCNPMGCEDVPGSIVANFYDVPPGDADAMMAAVAMQPISIAIQADQFPFQFYKTGVLTDDSCGAKGDIDHGVLLAGYGTDEETQEPYWLVKNSWGDSWGEAGYIRSKFLGMIGINFRGCCFI